MNAMTVTVCYSPGPRKLIEKVLLAGVEYAGAATVLIAIEQSGLLQEHPEIDLTTATVGVWGKKVSLSHKLQDHDRVEIYRPLRVDPKVARRERFQKQGAKTAGLFAKRRPGAKPGY
jgi:uncharacterized protein